MGRVFNGVQISFDKIRINEAVIKSALKMSLFQNYILFDFIIYRGLAYISKNLLMLNGLIFTQTFLPNLRLGGRE